MVRRRIFVETVRQGVVTYRYPYVAVEPPEGFRGKPVIDVEKCIGCGSCASACPPNAITIEDDVENGVRRVKLFLGRCIFCGRCADVCPEQAITLTREFELAAHSSEDLVQIVEVPMAQCELCGRYFAPLPLLAKALRSVDESARKFVVLCPECRTKFISNIISSTSRQRV